MRSSASRSGRLGGGLTWRRGFSISRRKKGATSEGTTWLAAASAATGRGTAGMADSALSAIAPIGGRPIAFLKRRCLRVDVTFLHAHGFPAGPALHELPA